MASLSDIVNIKPQRSLGTIVAQVTIEERHVDELTITDHPVEEGASISDHAYKRPVEVTLTLGWSDSQLANIEASPLGGSITSETVRDTYQKLLDLQNSRVPFDILTGKRAYKNMLIRSLATSTDEKNEHSLFVTVTCREVLIVQTAATAFPPKASRANPKKTTIVVKGGLKQTVPANATPGGAFTP